MRFTLPKWFDAHTHLRQGGLMAPIIESQRAMGCYGVLAMPNTKPPVAKVHKRDKGDCYSIEDYLEAIRAKGGDAFDDVIVPLYVTRDITCEMIEEGARSGLLRAAKYYPPHGTTNADFGCPMADLMQTGILQALSDNNVILCIHGEQHGLAGEAYFDRAVNAENYFYGEYMPRLRDSYPDLKIVGEHVTTRTAVDFIKQAGERTAATITPQHLLYTVGHLIQGLKYHLFCLPVVKFDEDRQALRDAVTAAGNTRFFAGTDSAAHTVKATDCGCAAGCFTGGIAPQLYAQAFEEAGLDLGLSANQDIFRNFLCHNGVRFYEIKRTEQSFTLVKKPQDITPIETDDGPITPLPLGLGQATIPWSIDD